MPSADKLFLLGLPGSGKTSLGTELAQALQLTFVDLDREIERRAGKAIKNIFSDMGEDRFREMESAELSRWCNSDVAFVMATGGGTPCFHNNIDQINAAGTSIFLDVPIAELVKRMERTPLAERPLLREIKGLGEKMEKLHAERIVFYGKAAITVSGSRLTAEQVLQKLTV